jgi:hypothetical protein
VDGFTIPIGADFSVMQAAVDRIIEAMDRMGDRITAAMQQSSAATSEASAKLARTVDIAGNMGDAFSGAHAAMKITASASRTLAGVNLAQSLSQWVANAGGLRAALATLPGRMLAIARNPTFQKVAAAALVAVTALYTVRTAFRAVTGSIHLLESAALKTFRGMVAAARAAGSAIKSAFNGISSGIGMMMPGGLAIGGILSAAGAIGVAVNAIGKAAEMETLQTAFAPLLGGAKAAKERIEQLAKFAATTPFELPQIAQASRTLQTLTKGALATGEGLRLAGDVASGTQQPIEELAMWIGRLYDGLQSGRPVGEAMMRLQELGSMSGDVRSRIEALQEEGAKGPAVWGLAAAALSRFSGSMERQSVTWKGKLSNLSDSVGMLMAKFGEPIIDGLKPYLDIVIGKVESLKNAGIAAGNAIRTALDTVMASFQTGTFLPLLMNGLELAFLKGVNVFIHGIQSGLKILSLGIGGIMGALGEGLEKSGLADVFHNLANALGATISAAIMSTIGKITGWKGWEIDAANERQNAAGAMYMAKDGMKNLDFLGGADALGKKLEETFAKIKAEWTDPKRTPFADTTEAEQSVNELGRLLFLQIQKNRDAAAKLNEAMDSKLKNPSADSGAWDAKEKLGRAIQPAVMSLTRIGGGGFAATVMGTHLAEARKQTGWLKQIHRTLEQPARPITARYA